MPMSQVDYVVRGRTGMVRTWGNPLNLMASRRFGKLDLARQVRVTRNARDSSNEHRAPYR